MLNIKLFSAKYLIFISKPTKKLFFKALLIPILIHNLNGLYLSLKSIEGTFYENDLALSDFLGSKLVAHAFIGKGSLYGHPCLLHGGIKRSYWVSFHVEICFIDWMNLNSHYL